MLRAGSRPLPLSRALREFLAGAGATEARGRAACRYFIDGMECVTLDDSLAGPSGSSELGARVLAPPNSH